MDPKNLLDLIAAGAVVAWGFGFYFVLRTLRLMREPSTGELTIKAPLARVRAAVLASLSGSVALAPFFGVEIVAATDDELQWQTTRGPMRHRGLLKLRSEGDSTRANFALHVSSSLLVWAILVNQFALCAIVVLYFLLRNFVQNHENHAMAMQVVQMVQAVHVLWPPFLLAGLPRSLRKRLVAEVERTLRNSAFA